MQTKIILVLSIVVIAFGGCLQIAKMTIDRLKTERDQAISFNNARHDSLTYYVNKVGRETARADVHELSARNTREMLEDERLAWITKFESVNKRLNNIEQATRTTAVAMGNFKIPLRDTVIVNPDSSLTRARKFDNRDEWFRIKGTVYADTIVTTPSVPVPLESIIVWERRKKFLGIRYGRKKWSSETSSENPYVHITKHELIKIGKKK